MTVRAGFDGIGKIGGWLPIEVDLRNDGADLDGEIQIAVTDAAATRSPFMRAPTVYVAPAILPRRSHKRITLEAELRTNTQKIFARLVEGGNVVAEQEVQLSRVATGDLLCGVLSRNGPALDYLAGVELPAPLRRARIAHLEVADLPTRPQLLSSLDCLVFDNISTGSMLESQRAALSTWVHSGGLLVVIGGPTWQRTMGTLPPALLPVKVSGLTSLDSLSALAEFESVPLAVQGPWLVSQGIVSDGSVVVEQDGVPLIAAARRGLGTVLYLAVDPSVEPLRSWTGSAGVWRYVLAHAAGGMGSSSSASATFTGWGRMPRAALVDVSALPSPAVGPLIWLLLGFAVVVGPLNYVVLSRFGQLRWSLYTVPALTLVGSVAAFALAGAAQDSDVVLNKISVVRANGHAPAFSRTYVSMLTRQTGAFNVRGGERTLISGLLYPFPRDAQADPGGWAFRVAGGDMPELDSLQLNGGNLGTFLVDGPAPIAGLLDSDLRVEGRQLVGSIANGLDTPVSDVAVIIDFEVTRLGDFKAGESREVSIPLPTAAKAGFGPPSSFSNTLYPNAAAGKKPSDAARRDILDSAFGAGFNFSRLDMSGPLILGWVESLNVPITVGESRPASVENSLLIQTLPIGLAKGYEGELPPTTITRRQLGATTLNRQQYGSYELGNGESVALQFSLPTANDRFLLDGLYFNLDGRLRGPQTLTVPIGELSVFNWRTSEWEDRTVAFGRNLLRDPQPYVSAVGDIRVRYTFRAPPDSGVSGVTFSRFDVTASGVMR
ncbi:MAG: hypothetical protein U0821_13100 [Chloroflexota bacterium]